MLLLEREADGPWREELNKGDVKLEDPSEVVTLSLLDNPSSIIRAYAILASENAGGPAPLLDDEEVEEELMRLDEEMRPLFAAFLGDAIGRGEAFAGWDKARLVKDVLKRDEERYWSDATEKEKNLAALVTFCRGLFDETLESICEEGSGKVFPGHWNRDATGDRIGKITRSRLMEEHWFVGGLEPDLLGGLFGLERIGKLPSVSRKEFVTACHKTEPMQVSAMLALCHRDWPDHKSLPYFDQDLPKDLTFRRNWAHHCFGRIYYHGQANRLQSARQEFEKLTSFLSEIPSDAGASLPLAKASINLIIDYGKAEQIEEARTIFESLLNLQERFPDDEEIALRRAKGSVNLSLDYGKAGQTDEAKIIFEGLINLQERFPDDEEIALQRAMGSVNLISFLGKAGRIDEARTIFESLVDLQEKFPDDEEIVLRRVRGSVNLILDYGKVGLTEDARAIFETLIILQARFPDNAEIQSIVSLTIEASPFD